MKLIKSFGFALSGLTVALREQMNLKIHTACLAIALSAGGLYNIAPIEWVMILLAAALVISMELMNTAIESLIDLVSPGKSVLAGKVKDVAASAVLIASVVALIIGVVIFVPYVLK
jgi:diacylglycerol kinase